MIYEKIFALPNHIAIVPDGNGRWAERRGLPRLEGHRAGAENMCAVLDYLNEYPIKFVTVYGFSTENWNRPEDEVEGLFKILDEVIDKYSLTFIREGLDFATLAAWRSPPRVYSEQ